jgi:large subunit ribosomal protein L21
MYAVLVTGGKQYRVEAGTTLEVERLGGEPGASVTFDRVLMIGDEDAVTIGTPVVTGASVVGTVLGDAQGPKLVIFKFKQKVKYRRRTGHRQSLTRVRIDAIHPTAAAAEAAPRRTSATRAKPAAKPKTAATKPAAAKAEPAEADEAAVQVETAKPKSRVRRAAKPKAEE